MLLKGARDIGAYIGMSVPTFHRHKDVDAIPYFRAGHNICARSEDLDAWIDRQIAKEENDAGKENENIAAADIRDSVPMPVVREEVQSVPRQLQRVRRVPEKTQGDKGRTVCRRCSEGNKTYSAPRA